MNLRIELLVKRLCSHSSLSAQEQHYSYPFAVATEIAETLSPDERIAQTQRIFTMLSAFIGGQESQDDNANSTDGEFYNPDVFTIASVGALLCSTAEHISFNWEKLFLDLLKTTPPLSREFCSCLCYIIAQLILRRKGMNLLTTACSTSTGNDLSSGIPFEYAVEILSFCASLVSFCIKNDKSTMECGGNKKSDDSTIALKGKSSKSSPSVSCSNHGDRKNSTKQNKGHEKNTESNTPSSMTHSNWAPIISDVDIAHSKFISEHLISCCLTALGAEVHQRDGTVPALLCRQVLIPLLSNGGDEIIAKYADEIANLIESSDSSHEKRSDLIVLIAGLFDYLFPQTQDNVAKPRRDYRHSSFLWELLHASLLDACTAELDAGRRANIQLRAEYLLKRIVSITEEQEKALLSDRALAKKAPEHTFSFHPYFQWRCGGYTSRSWAMFFLVLETLNEFGLHIIQPALLKLDALVEELSRSTAIPCTGQDPLQLPVYADSLHPVWIEVLFLKLVLHPNLGIRKVGLRRLWALPNSVLRTLSSTLLFTHAFSSGTDPRLCSELDRLPITSTFLDTKAIEGSEVSLLPVVEPLASEVEVFYGRVFAQALTADPERRGEALRMMVRTTLSRPSRFCVCLLFRSIRHIMSVLMISGPPNVGSAIQVSDHVLDDLYLALRDCVQDSAPFWLDARLTCIAFEGLVRLSWLNCPPLTRRESFIKTLSMCGSMGQSRGKMYSIVDSYPYFGVGGSSVRQHYLSEKLLSISQTTALHDSRSFLHATLDLPTLASRVVNVLGSDAFDENHIKQLYFLVGTLHKTNLDTDQALLRFIVEQITTSLRSFGSRPYLSLQRLLNNLASFVELHRSLGTQSASQYFDKLSLLEIGEMLRLRLSNSLNSALRLLSGSENGLILDSNLSWEEMKTENWDVVTAAFHSVCRILFCMVPDDAHTQLRIEEVSEQLVTFLNEPLVKSIDQKQASSDQELTKNLAAAILARNASRLLQVALCSGLCTSSLPSKVALQPTITVPIELKKCFTPSIAASMIRSLVSSLHQRMISSKMPCSLSSLPWPFILGQHYRAVYNSIRVLCENIDTTSPERDTIVRLLYDFAVSEAESCWTSNLTSVYDILLWVISQMATDPTRFEDQYKEALQIMLGRLREVGSRRHSSAWAVTMAALRASSAFEDEENIANILLSILENPQESDRCIYLATLTAASLVLENPAKRWDIYKPLLLIVAVTRSAQDSDDEEAESTMAATEPIMASFPKEMAVEYLPAVRMATVARAIAVSTILYLSHLDSARAAKLTLELLGWNRTNPLVTREPCMPNSRSHRIRVRLWQLLCTLLPFAQRSVEDVPVIFDYLIQECVTVQNLGSVRCFIEIYAVKLLQKSPFLYPTLARELQKSDHRPQIHGSYILIACHTLLQIVKAGGKEKQEVLDALFPCIFQQCASHQHLLRIISHVGFFNVYNAYRAAGHTFSCEVDTLHHHLTSSPEHIKMRTKNEGLLFFDMDTAATPRQIFCVQRKEANNVLKDAIPAMAFERVLFLDAELRCLLGAITPYDRFQVSKLCHHLDLLGTLSFFKNFDGIPHTLQLDKNHTDYTQEALALLYDLHLGPSASYEAASGDLALTQQEADEASQNIQKKATAWWNSQIYNELHPRAQRTNRQPLIVVGSLLQKEVNIAGLFRCCEIFAAEKVIIPEKAILQHPHFLAAARSAELWFPWEEVPPRDLPEYLNSQRELGYTIVGIEQTAKSIPIAKFEFPKKSVIVLGAEGQGVPAPLIPLLDVCLEIPQYGLIRSLNVHVTGAIAIYEYTRQQKMIS